MRVIAAAILRLVLPVPASDRVFIRAAIDRHHHEDRVVPIYEQNDGSEQPTPPKMLEKLRPRKPAGYGEARLHYIAAAIGQLPLGEERPIIELKARGLLGGDVDVDRSGG